MRSLRKGPARLSDSAGVGFLNVNKPLYMTSHDVVASIRRRYLPDRGSRKVGHAGTLDPLADGVLIVCLGAATRLSEYVMRSRKVYRAEITLGSKTTTYDAAGEIIASQPTQSVSLNAIQHALDQFKGEILQNPPLYSAIKVKGRRLYEYARRGEAVARPPRRVLINRIAILDWSNPALTLEVHCGPGTYIRSLANDLGEALGTGGYLSQLTRLASGAFKLKDSVSLERLSQDDDWAQFIVSPFDALQDKPQVTLAASEIDDLSYGRFITLGAEIDRDKVFAFDSARQLVAILEPRDQQWKPLKVFLTPT